MLVALCRGPRRRGNLGGWLNGIVRNIVRDRRRKELRRTRHEGVLPAPSPGANPLDRAVQVAEQKRLLDAVQELPEPYRTTVWRRYFDDIKPRAIAREDGIPLETVRTRLKRASPRLDR